MSTEDAFAFVTVIRRDNRDGQALPLTDTMDIMFGRAADVDVRIQLKNVSKKHALLEADDMGHLFLANQSKRNHTYVNGKAIGERTRLNDGDVFAIGDRKFRIDYDKNFLKYLNKLEESGDSFVFASPVPSSSAKKGKKAARRSSSSNEENNAASSNMEASDAAEAEEVTMAQRLPTPLRKDIQKRRQSVSLVEAAMMEEAKEQQEESETQQRKLNTPLRVEITAAASKASQRRRDREAKAREEQEQTVATIDVELDDKEPHTPEPQQSAPAKKSSSKKRSAKKKKKKTLPTPIRAQIQERRHSPQQAEYEVELDQYEEQVREEEEKEDMMETEEAAAVEDSLAAQFGAAAAEEDEDDTEDEAEHFVTAPSTPAEDQAQWEEDGEIDWEQDAADWTEPVIRKTLKTPLAKEIRQHIFYPDSTPENTPEAPKQNGMATPKQHIFFSPASEADSEAEWLDDTDTLAVRHAVRGRKALATPARAMVESRRLSALNGNATGEADEWSDDEAEEEDAEVLAKWNLAAHPTPVRDSVQKRRQTWGSTADEVEAWSEDEADAEADAEPEQQEEEIVEQTPPGKRGKRLATPLMKAIQARRISGSAKKSSSKKKQSTAQRRKLATPMRKAIEAKEVQLRKRTPSKAKGKAVEETQEEQEAPLRRKLATPTRNQIVEEFKKRTMRKKVMSQNANRTPIKEQVEKRQSRSGNKNGGLSSPGFKAEMEKRRQSIRGSEGKTPERSSQDEDEDEDDMMDSPMATSARTSIPTPVREELKTKFADAAARKRKEMDAPEDDAEAEAEVEETVSNKRQRVEVEETEDEVPEAQEEEVEIEESEEIEQVPEIAEEEAAKEAEVEAEAEAEEEVEVEEEEEPEVIDYSSWKVVDLRKQLKEMGLATAGKKAVLVARIEEAMEAGSEDEAEVEVASKEEMETEEVASEVEAEAEDEEAEPESEPIDFSALRVRELREELKTRGLDTTGKKAVLVARLVEFESTQAEPEAEVEPEVEPEPEAEAEAEVEAEVEQEPEVDYSSWTVAKLRKELKSLGASTAGKKAELVARLQQGVATEAEEEQDVEEQNDEEEEEEEEIVDYSSWKVTELRKLAKQLNVSAGGKKVDIISRIQQAQGNSSQSAADDDNSDDDEDEMVVEVATRRTRRRR